MPTTNPPRLISNMRGVRYGEVLAAYARNGGIGTDVCEHASPLHGVETGSGVRIPPLPAPTRYFSFHQMTHGARAKYAIARRRDTAAQRSPDRCCSRLGQRRA